MLAERVLARAWERSRTVQAQPEGFLAAALALVLETTDAWPRFVAHFRWPVPVGPFVVTVQDRVTDGRSDLRLRFSDGRQVVLELKAGPAPHAAQLDQYAEPGVQVIGLATTARRHAADAVVGTTTWADLIRVPWPTPPLGWRQFVLLAHALDGVAVPPVDVAALVGLQASYDAQETVFTWAKEASDVVASRLSRDNAKWVVKQGKRGRRFLDRTHRRQMAWAWPAPWTAHPYAGVLVGLYMGHPSLPVLVPGLPDLRLLWHARPGEALHDALKADPTFRAAAQTWTSRGNAPTVRAWDSAGWAQLSARCSSAILLDTPEPGRAFLEWVSGVLDEWDTAGISAALARHVQPSSSKAQDDEDGPPVDADPDGQGAEP